MNIDSQPTRLQDYRPPPFTIDTVNLDFRLDPQASRVTAALVMRRQTDRDEPLILAGGDLTLLRLLLDGAELPAEQFDVTANQLIVRGLPDSEFTLTVETEIDPSASTELMGLFWSSGAYCTQCEAEGFRRITYFLDRPDVLAVYTTRIEAEIGTAPILLSNGNLTASGEVPGTDRHYAVWHDPFPKPSYLFALVAGDFGSIRDQFTTESGRNVGLAIFCEHGKERRCHYAMDALKRAMRWDEEVFGREYDLDVFNIVAVPDFNMAAMENKGLNIFNDRFVLADRETATDADYSHIESVIAHEYFHNWTGNRITCRDWFQICLKEGLTVFREQEFSADMRSRAVKRIDDVRTLKARQFPEDSGPLSHPVRPEIYHEINNFYTATVYDKGAELVRMLKTLLGQDGFRRGTDYYFDRHDGEAATVEDFLAAFADSNDYDLTQFKIWYEQAGNPLVVAKGSYDPSQSRYRLVLTQSTPATPGQPTKQPLHIPIRFGLVGASGNDIPYQSVEGATVKGDIIHLTATAQEVSFAGVSERPVPSLLRGFSAPVRLEANLDPEDLLFLARSDSDTYNRWQAAQTLTMKALTEATAAIAQDANMPDQSALNDALGEVAENAALDPALRAQILSVPTESEVAREIGRDVDPDAIAVARRHFRETLGRTQSRALGRVYETIGDDDAFVPDAKGQGRRSLRNVALDLLVAGDESRADIARLQYGKATNMTDRIAALTALNQRQNDSRSSALRDFRDRYAADALVLDKWFAMEATAPFAGAVERVKELMNDEVFSIDNPNRVRALIGSFATGNATQFNRADGTGFDFVADVVLRLDKTNPQTAARLLVSFRSWRALETTRRRAAERALDRLAAAPIRSPDVDDIIKRILA